MACRLLILGSCVSRDILEHAAPSDPKLVLVDYFARSSLASLGAAPIRKLPQCLENLSSSFQRRMVERDLDKTFWRSLSETNFDVLLLDPIDERFNLWRDETGALATLSVELISSGFEREIAGAGQTIMSGSDAFWALWEKGWSRLVARLREQQRLGKLLINRVYWSHATTNGTPFPPAYNSEGIEAANALLKRMYSRMELDVRPDQFLKFTADELTSADTHRWGVSPFHYVGAYYGTAIQQLSQFFAKMPLETRNSGISTGRDSEQNPMTAKHSATATSDYSAWRTPLHNPESLEAFLALTRFKNGIYRIPCAGSTLDVLIEGFSEYPLPAGNVCLVGLGGALSIRTGTKPPYFSGRGVAFELKLPLIAISDPSLALNEELPLAWYAGHSAEKQLPAKIAKILDHIAQQLQLKLILFGGSGGGFATLMQTTLLSCDYAAVVWNPQTSIEAYVPVFVVQYIKAAFPELACLADEVLALPKAEQTKRVAQLLDQTGIIHSLQGRLPPEDRQVIYLQNRHDWHVGAHAKPFLGQQGWTRLGASSFAHGDSLALHFGNWGPGHAAPPKELITQVISKVARGMLAADVATELDASTTPEEYCQWFAANHDTPNWKPEFSWSVEDGYLRIAVDAPPLPSSRNLEYAVYLVGNRALKKSLWYQSSPLFEAEVADIEFDTVQVFVRDIWSEQRIATSGSRHPTPPKEDNLNTASISTEQKDNEAPLAPSGISSGEFSSALQQSLQFFPQDFLPFNDLQVTASGAVSVPLAAYAETIVLAENLPIDWRMKFSTNHNSNTMWLLSLDFVGRLLSTFQSKKTSSSFSLARHCLKSFLEFSSSKENREHIRGIPSRDHATATRVKVLTKYLLVAKDNPESTLEFNRSIFEELHYWMEWLCEPEHFHLTNHGLMSSIALITASHIFNPASDLRKKYEELGFSRVLLLARTAFDRNGLCYENTIGYHNYNIGLYKIILRFATVQEIQGSKIPEIRRIIDLAETALRYCIRQDSTIPPIGDSPVYLINSASINEPKCFPESGFAVIKNDDLYLSLQCGSRTEFHKQMDDSSITLRYKGQDLIIDAGSYSYDRAAGFGRYVESATGHSGIFPLKFDNLRRKDVQHQFGNIIGGITRFEQSPDKIIVHCHYQTSSGKLIARRHILVRWPDEIAIVDQISTPEESGIDQKVQRFLFAPGVKLTAQGEASYTIHTGDLSASLFILHSDHRRQFQGQTDPDIRGWHSVNFGEILPNQVLESVSDSTTARFAVIFKLAKDATESSCSEESLNFCHGGFQLQPE